jgi:hypothetical protein
MSCLTFAHITSRDPASLLMAAAASPVGIKQHDTSAAPPIRKLPTPRRLTWPFCWLQEFLPPSVQPPFQVVVSAFLLQPWREVVAPSAAHPAAGSQVLPAAASRPQTALPDELLAPASN